MTRAVLLSPPFVKDYMRNARCDFVSLSHSNWYPIWLGFAGSLLEKNGYETTLIDAPAHGLSHDETFARIKSFKPDWVVMYSGRLSEDNDIAFGQRIYDHICQNIVFVGPYFSADPKATLSKISYPVVGIQKEFEFPLLKLLEGTRREDIPNLLYKSREEVIATPLQPYLTTEQLDLIPPVSKYLYENVDIRKYKVPSELYPYIDTMYGRGCAYGKCAFCLWVHTFIEGSRYNKRSLDHFLDELEYISKHMKEVRSLMIQDDMLPGKFAHEVAEGILQRGLKLKWSCYMKPNKTIPLETFQAMKRSGCMNLHVGFESGDEEVLKRIGKGNSIEDSLVFSRNAHQAGLKLHADFAYGFPGETRQNAQKTLRLAKTINPYSAQFQVIIPFKGTPLYEMKDRPEFNHEAAMKPREVEGFAKYSYKRFYLSFPYFKKIITQPRDYFWNRLDTYIAAIPAIFWKRWVK